MIRGAPEDSQRVEQGVGDSGSYPALRTRGVGAAEGRRHKLPTAPVLSKAEPRLGSQGLQGRTGVSHPESQRTSGLEGESQKRLGVPGILVPASPHLSGTPELGVSQACALCYGF